MTGAPGKRVLTYGTFDLFHQGHVRLLHRLAALGDSLIVGCATDDLNASRGQSCLMGYAQRFDILSACRHVDLVIPEHHEDQKRTDIVNHNVSIFAMPDAWRGQFDDLNDLAQVIYLPTDKDLLSPDLPSLATRSRLLSAG